MSFFDKIEDVTIVDMFKQVFQCFGDHTVSVGQSPQRGPGVESLVRGQGLKFPWIWTFFIGTTRAVGQLFLIFVFILQNKYKFVRRLGSLLRQWLQCETYLIRLSGDAWLIHDSEEITGRRLLHPWIVHWGSALGHGRVLSGWVTSQGAVHRHACSLAETCRRPQTSQLRRLRMSCLQNTDSRWYDSRCRFC